MRARLGCIVLLPDDTLMAFSPKEENGRNYVASRVSTDHGRSWQEPKVEFDLPGESTGCYPVLDREGELHVFITLWRGGKRTGRRPGTDLFLDLWHSKTSNARTQWSKPRLIYEAYIGALMQAIALAGGRIIVPFADWEKGATKEGLHGSHVIKVVYTDDFGKTFDVSPARLVAPCYPGYNGNNYGACEPVVLELKDGRVWMLMRTQTGWLYESFSPDGVRWSDAQPSRFRSSTSPASLIRLSDGRIMVFWNNCEMPPRHDGGYVYGGRDELHAAVSDDEGATWVGYRTIYRDPLRDEPPPVRGDRGTAYPFAAATSDSKAIVCTGQAGPRLATLLIDPQWLYKTHVEADFSAGLEDWSVFKEFGPSKHGHWRDRTQGAHLIDHPTTQGAKVLHVRAPDERGGDTATWNFPVAQRGTLSLRVLLNDGFGGAVLSLNDRFFQPGDDAGERQALYCLPVASNGQLGKGPKLETGRWYELALDWDTAMRNAAVLLDGRKAMMLKMQNLTLGGVCYLRLRSMAEAVDPAGLLVESVSVDIAEPGVPEKGV